MKNERGYTIAELTVALLVFGLMIAFVLPIFQEIQASAHQQANSFEGTQIMVDQLERLRSTCLETREGSREVFRNKTKLKYHVKWTCKINQSLVQIGVKVQWKDKQGKYQTKQIQTHHFLTNKDSPT